MRRGKLANFRAYLAAGAAVIAVAGLSAGPMQAKKNNEAAIPASITPQEKAEGAKAHPEILQEFGGVYQSPQTAYVVRVGKEIALQSGLGNAESDFTVSFLNSPVNNAFAIPGGYIYITRQLAGLCNSEAEMAGVLGHEVGHVAARHGKKRQRAASRASILGVLGQVAGGMLGDNGGIVGALGGLAKQYSGQLAQIITLKYSRGQEEESDDLGIKYLSKAGYDPSALSDMLRSLAMQTAVDARAAGQDARSVPEWASTHPEPAKRVARAAAAAKNYPASTVRKQDTHFNAINGMLYDDDPQQGVIEGQEFLHPDLRLRFSVPAGYGMQNSTQAVVVNGNGGKGLFTTAAYSGNKQAYIDAAFKAVAGKQQISYGNISQTTVNGIPAFYATALVAGQQGGQNAVTVFAYEFSASQAFHFVTIAPANADPFNAMYQSVKRLSQAESAGIKPRKLRIVTVGKSDTISSLAAKMAYGNLQTERFLALNGLQSNQQLASGRKVKIVTY
jgi:predicted Zn-dependent protease